jgi:NADH-quinone oxidoreductase subunit G
MACPRGCVGGAGQPVYNDPAVVGKRARGIYENDRMLELHKAQENPYITEVYRKVLGDIGGRKAHKLLHTTYRQRKRIFDTDVTISEAAADHSLEVHVCFGTGCFLKGAQRLLRGILDHVTRENLTQQVGVAASFCFEKCDRGPVVRVGSHVIEQCTLEAATASIDRQAGVKAREVRAHGRR